VKNELYKCNGRVAELVKTKMNFILKKNKEFKTLLKIRSIINGEYKEEEEDVNINLIPGQLASFKYAPITSYDVERSFSQYKFILHSNRRSFVFENLEQHIYIYIYMFILSRLMGNCLKLASIILSGRFK
jgi:hypothetical protein